MRAGYDAAAEAWADGPGQMYTQLARVLVASAPMPLAGRRVLDLGAGAGVAGQAALAQRGACRGTDPRRPGPPARRGRWCGGDHLLDYRHAPRASGITGANIVVDGGQRYPSARRFE
jgi:hypothetical protein